MSSNSIYGYRRNGNAHGDVFTSHEVVCYMLNLIGYTADKDLSKTTILEPACGEGAFLVEIAERLKLSAEKHGFDVNSTFSRCVRAYDIDKEKVEICKQRLSALGITCAAECIITDDFLTTPSSQYDAVIGNPPYVRYENIPPEKKLFYKTLFPSFHYRADLYILFYEKSLQQLKPEGKHCFICANRWLKNEYGKKLRMLVAQRFSLEKIVNLEHTDVFSENVLAYPAITLISNTHANHGFAYGNVSCVTDIQTTLFEKREQPLTDDWSTSFNIVVHHQSLHSIEEQGFKIGIGVATGADRIFISNQLPDMVEQELLLPALNARDLRGNSFHWDGEYLLNPYQKDGELIDLSQYPMAEKYLNTHKDVLTKRHIVRNGAKWYKTIDRINPNLLHQPKILLPDISGNTYIFTDEGNYYPLHNLYYITGKTLRELMLLSAILMSDNVRQQITNLTNNMHGGFPRWQSQYLQKLRIPAIDTLDPQLSDSLLNHYLKRDYAAINHVAKELFEHPDKNPIKYKPIRDIPRQISIQFAG